VEVYSVNGLRWLR